MSFGSYVPGSHHFIHKWSFECCRLGDYLWLLWPCSDHGPDVGSLLGDSPWLHGLGLCHRIAPILPLAPWLIRVPFNCTSTMPIAVAIAVSQGTVVVPVILLLHELLEHAFYFI
mmetsp:Transcript_14479/g.30798  ORF Transcript_14479/g.30798 Transcript_14479/m.30798 type:complete len:114 (+) Transcript_14479:101-442(+)